MYVRVLALVCVTLGACRAESASIQEARADEPPAGAGGVAVVELFTSEGCSSCPPADAVLADLARSSNRSVYALAFHVDYWDELGWPDRFASHANTQRQGAYARAFGAGGVYTPQMIVGGTEQFTGSDRARATAAVARALAQPAGVRLSLRAEWAGPDAIRAEYEETGAPAGSVLVAAIVQREATTSVGAGENAGRTLHHANVVRAFAEAPIASPTGSLILSVPASLPRDGAELVAYVQHGAVGGGGTPVLGAARSQLAPR